MCNFPTPISAPITFFDANNNAFNVQGIGDGRGRGPWSNNLSQCQLCERSGHLVSTYWHRFENNFVMPHNQKSFALMAPLPPYQMTQQT